MGLMPSLGGRGDGHLEGMHLCVESVPSLQPLQKIESGKGHRGREPCAMEGVSDEVREGRGRCRGG